MRKSRIKRICARCLQVFLVGGRQREQSQKFCSRRCYAEERRQNGRACIRKPLDQTCVQCGSPFRDKPTKITAGRRFCSNRCRDAWQSALPFEEWRGKLSANLENRARGARNGMFGRTAPHPKPVIYVRADGLAVKMRSTWEATAARYLDSIGEDWVYEPRRFDFGGESYVPDFLLTSTGCYWEIKGWFHERARRKVQRFRELFPHIPLAVIDKSGYGLIVSRLQGAGK